MAYWLYSKGDIEGPFNIDELVGRDDFRPTSLVCPEDKLGESSEDWMCASEFDELRAALDSSGRADAPYLPEQSVPAEKPGPETETDPGLIPEFDIERVIGDPLDPEEPPRKDDSFELKRAPEIAVPEDAGHEASSSELFLRKLGYKNSEINKLLKRKPAEVKPEATPEKASVSAKAKASGPAPQNTETPKPLSEPDYDKETVALLKSLGYSDAEIAELDGMDLEGGTKESDLNADELALARELEQTNVKKTARVVSELERKMPSSGVRTSSGDTMRLPRELGDVAPDWIKILDENEILQEMANDSMSFTAQDSEEEETAADYMVDQPRARSLNGGDAAAGLSARGPEKKARTEQPRTEEYKTSPRGSVRLPAVEKALLKAEPEAESSEGHGRDDMMDYPDRVPASLFETAAGEPAPEESLADLASGVSERAKEPQPSESSKSGPGATPMETISGNIPLGRKDLSFLARDTVDPSVQPKKDFLIPEAKPAENGALPKAGFFGGSGVFSGAKPAPVESGKTPSAGDSGMSLMSEPQKEIADLSRTEISGTRRLSPSDAGAKAETVGSSLFRQTQATMAGTVNDMKTVHVAAELRNARLTGRDEAPSGGKRVIILFVAVMVLAVIGIVLMLLLKSDSGGRVKKTDSSVAETPGAAISQENASAVVPSSAAVAPTAQAAPEAAPQFTPAPESSGAKSEFAINIVKKHLLPGGKGTVEGWLANSLVAGLGSQPYEERWEAKSCYRNTCYVYYKLLQPRKEPVQYGFVVDIEKSVIKSGINNKAVELLGKDDGTFGSGAPAAPKPADISPVSAPESGAVETGSQAPVKKTEPAEAAPPDVVDEVMPEPAPEPVKKVKASVSKKKVPLRKRTTYEGMPDQLPLPKDPAAGRPKVRLLIQEMTKEETDHYDRMMDEENSRHRAVQTY
ncbi:MAG: hypothetical protein WCS77_03490 [Elusimicrobiaceae bacterium]